MRGKMDRDGVVSIIDPVDIKIEWRDIPGFSNYQACSLGLIRHRRLNKVGNPYEIETSKGTYLRCSAVSDDGSYRTKEIHYLVCLAFHGPPPDDGLRYEVNHLDGNKHNNLPSNLEWSTRSDNIKHSYETGLRRDNRKILVHDHLTNETLEFYALAQLARYFQITKSETWPLVTNHREVKYRDRYTFSFIDIAKTKPRKQPWVRTVKALDYQNKKLYVADDLGTMELLTGVKRGTISWNLKRGKTNLVKGFVFLYMDSKMEFPSYSDEEVKISLERSTGKGFPIRVTDTLSNTTEVWPTVAAFAKHIGLKCSSSVGLGLKRTPGQYKHYLIEFISRD